jgi:hypothetical protein
MQRLVFSLAVAAGAVVALAAPASASGVQVVSSSNVVLTPSLLGAESFTGVKLPHLTPKSVEALVILPY